MTEFASSFIRAGFTVFLLVIMGLIIWRWGRKEKRKNDDVAKKAMKETITEVLDEREAKQKDSTTRGGDNGDRFDSAL